MVACDSRRPKAAGRDGKGFGVIVTCGGIGIRCRIEMARDC